MQQSYEQTMTIFRSFGASAIAQITAPIYQGGAEYSLIRQSKENLAQQRLVLEQTRDQTRANTVTAWGQLVAGKAQVASAQAQVTASEIALNGVREEAKAGQRTTLDVLNAQQALVNARVALVTAQHDRVVASYAVLSAVGRLSPQVLNLPTTVYDPSVHYQQVRDSWYRRPHARRPLIARTVSVCVESGRVLGRAIGCSEVPFCVRVALSVIEERMILSPRRPHSGRLAREPGLGPEGRLWRIVCPALLAIKCCRAIPLPQAAERFAPHPASLGRDASVPWAGAGCRAMSRGA